MAMGTRKKRQRQEALWYGGELPTAPGHPFYRRLNEVLDNAKFDPFCETSCASFYHRKLGRPSLPPGQYFRVMRAQSAFAMKVRTGQITPAKAVARRARVLSDVTAGTICVITLEPTHLGRSSCSEV